MAKKSMIAREVKRKKLVKKYAAKRKLLLDDRVTPKYDIVPNTSITIFEPTCPYKVIKFACTKHLKSIEINQGIA